MGLFVSFILSLEVIIWTFLVGALIYLIFQRIEEKENETFEDRDF